jgi:hypothetical protein
MLMLVLLRLLTKKGERCDDGAAAKKGKPSVAATAVTTSAMTRHNFIQIKSKIKLAIPVEQVEVFNVVMSTNVSTVLFILASSSQNKLLDLLRVR